MIILILNVFARTHTGERIETTSGRPWQAEVQLQTRAGT